METFSELLTLALQEFPDALPHTPDAILCKETAATSRPTVSCLLSHRLSPWGKFHDSGTQVNVYFSVQQHKVVALDFIMSKI